MIEYRPQRRKRGPHLLVFLLVPLLVAATVGWRYWKTRRQEFPLIAERGRTEGIPALEEGNFDKAYQLLSSAKSALDALGDAVEGAEEIRQAADEAAIFVDLCSRSLEELLEEAGRTAPEAWATRFDMLYKGRSILIDTRITAVPGESGSKGYAIEYRVFPPGEASQFGERGAGGRPERFAEFDLAGFELLELARPSSGNLVRFGARLASLRYEGDRDRWVVRLEPKTGIFIQHYKALSAMGWSNNDEPSPPPEGPR